MLAGAILASCTAGGSYRGEEGRDLLLKAQPGRLHADGVSSALIEAFDAETHRTVTDVSFQIREGGGTARLDGNLLRAGVNPGRVLIAAEAPGFRKAETSVELAPDYSDTDGDGIPDVLRLTRPLDRRAFVEWFTLLAESVYVLPENRRPPEVSDCAALLRFAFREALRRHTGEWAAGLDLPVVGASSEITRYHYPFTPLGANLFRVRAGSFQPADLSSGAFAQFADAETLMRYNTYPVTRDIRLAEPGDLLFYRQLEQHMPFHAMVYLGQSRFDPGPATYVVYHTGPLDGGPGEIRRPSVDELLQHPSPRWRPNAGNPNFLGVFRWKILREST